MPYKRKGRTILHKTDGWSKKQTAGSVPKAKRALNLLRGIEHGWEPTGQPARDTRTHTDPGRDERTWTEPAP